MNGESGMVHAPGFHLLEPSASLASHGVNHLFAAMTLLCGAVALLIAALIVGFAIRYRRGSRANRNAPPTGAPRLEMAWTFIPLAIFLAVFTWGAWQFVDLYRPPADALPVYVVGKQWMWQIQHPNGHREIDELHVPLGRAVRLLMTSQDVIHSFSIPAFRIKQDVLPGRYTSLWFTPSALGDYRLFCAEYCGTEHSAMIGRIVVMRPEAYARWLDSGPSRPSLAEQGYTLFRSHGCAGCHDAASTVHAPLLQGLLGRRVTLQDGRSLVADENYVRDSILTPLKDVVAGYAPVMPSFAGQLDETDIEALIAWLRSTDAMQGEAPRR